MKKIIRLCESELSQIIENTAKKIIREMDEELILQAIAQEIADMGEIDAQPGQNSIEVVLDDESGAYIYFTVNDNSYVIQRRYHDRDLEDEDIINNDIELIIDEIEWYADEGDTSVTINDNNDIIKNAIEDVLSVEHDDLPYENELMYYEY